MSIRGNGYKICRKEMENKNFPMVINSKGDSWMDKKMDKEFIPGIKGHFKVILDIFKTISYIILAPYNCDKVDR